LNHGNYVVGSDQDTRIAVGAVLEIFLAISGIATAVVVSHRQAGQRKHRPRYIASRTVESILILVGVFSLMSFWPCASLQK
jgi:hypothetical protein